MVAPIVRLIVALVVTLVITKREQPPIATPKVTLDSRLALGPTVSGGCFFLELRTGLVLLTMTTKP